MERTKTTQRQKQLLLARAGMIGSALMIGLGLFMYAGNGWSPQDLRGDVLSPEFLQDGDIEILSTGEDMSTEEWSDADLEMMREEVLMEEGNMNTTTTSDPLGHSDPFMEDPAEKDLEELRAKVATQDMQKAQLRADTERFWAMGGGETLRGVAGDAPMDSQDYSEETAVGGPEAMPESGPGLLALLPAVLGGVWYLRRR